MKKIYVILAFTLLSLVGYSQEENKKPEAKRASASKENNSNSTKEQTKLPELKRTDATVSNNKEKATKNENAQPEKLLLKKEGD